MHARGQRGEPSKQATELRATTDDDRAARKMNQGEAAKQGGAKLSEERKLARGKVHGCMHGCTAAAAAAGLASFSGTARAQAKPAALVLPASASKRTSGSPQKDWVGLRCADRQHIGARDGDGGLDDGGLTVDTLVRKSESTIFLAIDPTILQSSFPFSFPCGSA